MALDYQDAQHELLYVFSGNVVIADNQHAALQQKYLVIDNFN